MGLVKILEFLPAIGLNEFPKTFDLQLSLKINHAQTWLHSLGTCSRQMVQDNSSGVSAAGFISFTIREFRHGPEQFSLHCIRFWHHWYTRAAHHFFRVALCVISLQSVHKSSPYSQSSSRSIFLVSYCLLHSRLYTNVVH
jgi:hypothetical protein